MTVVGIGASAGGLDAFHRFFSAMPSDSGMAFVVVMHLPADRKSMFPEILARWTAMRVVEVTDGEPIEPDHVYVPPPHAVTTLDDNLLRVRMPAVNAPRDARPIDGFFDSLAANLREDAVGIVLSGTGSDGALGLKAIKEVGGLTIAQGGDGSGPLFDGMPTGAIATGSVDLIAVVEDMPAHLLRLRGRHQSEEASDEPSAEEVEAARLKICSIIRAQLGHDFSGYKDKTFLRRVQRRMLVVNILSLNQYIGRLETDHEEVVLLFRDLLIRVTSFFRDRETFQKLEQVAIPRLFQEKSAESTVRVWVPGCATGEEAYSLAILLREHIGGRHDMPTVQIFATDIDDAALSTARAGRYPTMLLEGLSRGRRERFFTSTESGFVVTKEIREICTFSAHSLVRDPPFSRMDLISCRNLLIYLDNNMQGVVIPAFHYSLVPGGLLLLGSSETTARHDNLFAVVDKDARLFQRRDVKSPILKSFTSTNARRGAPDEQPQAPSADHPAWPKSQTRVQQSGTRSDVEPARIIPSTSRPSLMTGLRNRLRGGVRGAVAGLSSGSLEAERLANELGETRRELQSVTEEHETALEELRSSNEELHSVNEELQSTNEEVETSKEEIQSVNEELHTVNAQLSEKVDELDRANSDLRNLFASTDIATVFLDRHLIVRGFTPAVGTLYNLIPSDHGRPLTDIVSHLDYNGLREDVRHVLNTLEPLERRVSHSDKETFFILRILPYRGPDSTVNGVLVTFLNVTSIVQAENHHRLLIDELNHRVKNMLTVVISLASQTLHRAETVQEFSTSFMGRVQALAASYTLLTRQNWSSVSLRDVLVEETRPFQSRHRANFLLQGPGVKLAPQAALALGMAIHELVTNAVKYGALSVAEGTVRIEWRIDNSGETQEFVLDWTEEDGPAVGQPSHRGFGMTLIERGFAHELSGQASVHFAEGGLRARLQAPVGKSVSVAEAEPVAVQR